MTLFFDKVYTETAINVLCKLLCLIHAIELFNMWFCIFSLVKCLYKAGTDEVEMSESDQTYYIDRLIELGMNFVWTHTLKVCLMIYTDIFTNMPYTQFAGLRVKYETYNYEDYAEKIRMANLSYSHYMVINAITIFLKCCIDQRDLYILTPKHYLIFATMIYREFFINEAVNQYVKLV